MFSNLKLTEKQTGFKWNQEVFQIDSAISDNYLYLASEETLLHNGKKLISKGGIRAKKSLVTDFKDHNNELHKVEVKFFPVRSWWLSFTVLIDDIIVYKGSTPIKGIFASIAIYIPIGFLIFLFMGRLVGLFSIIFKF
ncbi:hypothetical protein ACFLYK_00610 [Candidatus Cloacimonadota bacterium]